MLRVKRLNDDARLPTRGSTYAAGLDLYATVETIVPSGGNALVSTGISVEIPEGLYGRIAPRSGFSMTTGLIVNAGVVDSDYRGELFVLFNNFQATAVKIHKGTKMAQLILEKISLLDVEEVDSLNDTERGEGGFGSTGV